MLVAVIICGKRGVCSLIRCKSLCVVQMLYVEYYLSHVQHTINQCPSFYICIFVCFSFQVVASHSALCVDIIEACWCLVLDKWRGFEFWPVYKAFVKLTFQNCFLQPGVESNLADAVRKVGKGPGEEEIKN